MKPDASFLGTGWSFPPQFSRGGAEVHLVSDAEDIRQSLEILLATAQGERVMQAGFGADLRAFQFEEIDQGLINQITALISDGILHHEPRIRLDGLDVSESPREPGLLLISITYTIRATNSRFNLVYPFCVNEGAGAGVRNA